MSRRRGVWVVFCAAVVLCPACTEPLGEPRHVVLISLDTLRADHLGCYGNTRVRTPAIDGLAAEGVLFADVTAAAPTTLASHTSIFTGTYPHTHGVPRNGFVLDEGNRMLPEILRDAGFRTAAFLGSFALSGRFGFDQGFDHFDESFDLEVDGSSYDQDQRRAADVTDAVLRWLEDVDGEARLFLFVHYFDVHAAYSPPPPYDTLYAADGGPRSSDFGHLRRAIRAHQGHLGKPARGFDETIVRGLDRRWIEGADGQPLPGDAGLAALYAGEVSYVDDQIGRLLDGLRRRKILDRAVVVLTSDHGETFWEHGDFWNHGLWVYQTTTQVPLIFRLPRGAGAGEKVDAPVSTVDILPTLLELIQLELPAGVEGSSLLPGLLGRALPQRVVFSEATQPFAVEAPSYRWPNRDKTKSVRSGSLKYVWSPYLDYEELFDLAADPQERHNLLARPAAETLRTRDRLRESLTRWTRSGRPRPTRLDEETLDRLRSLGYVGRPRPRD